MLIHLTYWIGLVMASLLFALVEVQIEGPEGWAGRLPTWQIRNRWTKWLYSSRPLTGYHLYIQLFVLLSVHLPFLLGLAPLTLAAEFRVLSFLVLFWVAEDYLWFVLNPAFGAGRFRREHIWWHAPTWWWIMPRDYWIYTPIGIALYILSWVSA